MWRWADEFFQDVRFGARMLWRSRAFSFLAILCLTLGIGTNAAVFGWIEGILVRPYPAVAHQERMFALAGTTNGSAGFNGLSYPDFLDLRKNCSLLNRSSSIASWEQRSPWAIARNLPAAAS
jgi:hypothetical protein